MLVYTAVFAVGLEGALVLIIAWAAAKIAVTWQRRVTDADEVAYRTQALTALMATVLSIAIATVGASVASMDPTPLMECVARHLGRGT
jgi:hypothetical protein